MKFDFTIRAGRENRHHKIALDPPPRRKDIRGRLSLIRDGEAFEADWAEIGPGAYSILLGGRSYDVRVEREARENTSDGLVFSARVATHVYELELHDARRRRHTGPVEAKEGPQEILAPMPGRIVKVLVSEDQEVSQGDGLLVIEAMKMQNELRAPRAGRVGKIYAREGMGIETGGKLIRLV